MTLRLKTKANRSKTDASGAGDLEHGPLVRLADVEKVYQTGRLEYAALRGVDVAIDRGELVAIVGPSGSGKSTILNILTGIDRPTEGIVTVAGNRIDQMNEEQLAAWRGENVGIVFQFFQLLPMLTALENATLPLEFARTGTAAERTARATSNLELVGLGDKLDHLPMEMSGGEQQRVAIARALACNPDLLVADEPTGNLDTETAAQMIELLTALNRDGMTVVYVTHDQSIADRAHRVVSIRDGLVADNGGTS
jgi:putative ABC transport system ATP-binding protein